MYPRGSNITYAGVIGVCRERIYRFMLHLSRSLVSVTNKKYLCELWHKWMAHLHHGALRVLREIVTGLLDFSTDNHDVCKGCALGKYTKTPFSSSYNRILAILDLIQSDLCGPRHFLSFSGYEYYVSFIDEYSRKTWILFMKTNNQVFKRFQEFKALVENQTMNKIKAFRTDNGGEYTCNEMDFCMRASIRREFTLPYNPQQNGVVERKNRAIVGEMRAMLHDHRLPFFLWVEACNTAVYMQNKNPHRVLRSKTPEEDFIGKNHEIGHFMIFEYLTYSRVLEDKSTKMEPTVEKGIFVGFSETSKAYCIYIPAKRKFVLRLDVMFEEERALRRSREDDHVE